MISQVGTLVHPSDAGGGIQTFLAPTGAQAGDLILFVTAWDFSLPFTGWTTIVGGIGGGHGVAAVYRFRQSGDGASYSINVGSDSATGGVIALRNVDSVTTIAATATTNFNFVTTADSPSITSGRDGCYLAAVCAEVIFPVFSITATASGPYTNRELPDQSSSQPITGWFDNLVPAATPHGAAGQRWGGVYNLDPAGPYPPTPAGTQPTFTWNLDPAFGSCAAFALNPAPG